MKNRQRRLQKSDLFWLLAAALLILLQFWWLPGDPGTPDDSYSNSVEGKRGIYETLARLSRDGILPPVRRETASLVPDERATLLVLSPDRYPNDHEQDQLADWVHRGGTLLFAPNWSDPDCSMFQLNISTTGESTFSNEDTATPVGGSPGTRSSRGGSNAPVGQPAEADEALPAEVEEDPDMVEADATVWRTTVENLPPPQRKIADTDEDDGTDVDLDKTPGLLPKQPGSVPLKEPDDTDIKVSKVETHSVLVAGSVPWRTRASMNVPLSRATILVATASGDTQAAAWTYGDGLVVVAASPDIFSNRSLLDDEQAELAVRLVEYAHAHHAESNHSDPKIIVNEFLNASDSYRATGVLMSPGLRSGTLQLILIAVLAGWYGFHRFGPPVKTNDSQRRSLTDSATAVGNLQFRSQGGAESVRCYSDYLNTSLRRMFAGTISLDDFAAVAHRTGLTADEVQRRAEIADSVAANSHASHAEAAKAIRDLVDLHARLTGGTDVTTAK